MCVNITKIDFSHQHLELLAFASLFSWLVSINEACMLFFQNLLCKLKVVSCENTFWYLIMFRETTLWSLDANTTFHRCDLFVGY